MTGKALVTGGAGYIGSHLVEALLGDGWRVTVVDNLSTGQASNLDAAVRAGAVLRRGSVLDADLIKELTKDADIVYHLAAAVGVAHIMRDPVGTMLTNVRGTEVVLEAAQRQGTRVVVASTSEVYGRSEEIPFREDGNRVLGPTWIHRWSYSTAKALDEHLAFAYAEQGLRVSVVRYFNSYGPRIREEGYGSVVARFASQALRGDPLTVHGDGRQTRCFTFVDDTVRGTRLAGERDEALGQAFNVGRAEEITVLDLATRIRDHLSSRSAIVFVPHESHYGRGFEDTRRRVPDVTKARERLGFEARVSFAEGLARTLDWCRAHYAGA